MSAPEIRPVRGMPDAPPAQAARLRHAETTLIKTAEAFGFEEIRLPLLERCELFARSVGEATDIVEKEMYAFEDRSGERLCLRPEGTAGCVRAAARALLPSRRQRRLWYAGAFFRRERPQKGRYRQFHQVGAEMFGFASPAADAELIELSAAMLARLGLRAELRLNTLGDAESRARYRLRLVDYLRAHAAKLDSATRARIDTNPLRALDSKNPAVRAVLADAPRIGDALSAASREHFARLKELLDAAELEFVEDQLLVRGLDYYTGAVFEWQPVGDDAAQSALCAGGRYDNLVEELGGPALPAAGFAVGVERVAALCDADPPRAQVVCMAPIGERAERAAPALAARLRSALPGCAVLARLGGDGLKKQLRRADKAGVDAAIVIGDAELDNAVCAVKWLRESLQEETPLDQLEDFMAARLAELREDQADS